MNINPISMNSRVYNAPHSQKQPSFKMHNYAKVFEAHYKAPITSVEQAEEIFKKLLYYAKEAHYTHKSDLFCYGMYSKTLIENLKNMLKPGNSVFANTTLRPKETLTVLSTSKAHKPIIDVYNGKFSDKNDITNIIFHGHDASANKTIEFGVDTNNKLFITRTSRLNNGTFFKEVLLTPEEL